MADPFDITNAAKDNLKLEEAGVLNWINNMIKKHVEGIAILDDYALAMEYREILGENDFKYTMHEVEWGYLYGIAKS